MVICESCSWVVISAATSLPPEGPWPVGVNGLKVAKFGVLKLGLNALEKALSSQGGSRLYCPEACLGVSKEDQKEGEVGVRVGVGGSPVPTWKLRQGRPSQHDDVS